MTTHVYEKITYNYPAGTWDQVSADNWTTVVFIDQDHSWGHSLALLLLFVLSHPMSDGRIDGWERGRGRGESDHVIGGERIQIHHSGCNDNVDQVVDWLQISRAEYHYQTMVWRKQIISAEHQVVLPSFLRILHPSGEFSLFLALTKQSPSDLSPYILHGSHLVDLILAG